MFSMISIKMQKINGMDFCRWHFNAKVVVRIEEDGTGLYRVREYTEMNE